MHLLSLILGLHLSLIYRKLVSPQFESFSSSKIQSHSLYAPGYFTLECLVLTSYLTCPKDSLPSNQLLFLTSLTLFGTTNLSIIFDTSFSIPIQKILLAPLRLSLFSIPSDTSFLRTESWPLQLTRLWPSPQWLPFTLGSPLMSILHCLPRFSFLNTPFITLLFCKTFSGLFSALQALLHTSNYLAPHCWTSSISYYPQYWLEL